MLSNRFYALHLRSHSLLLKRSISSPTRDVDILDSPNDKERARCLAKVFNNPNGDASTSNTVPQPSRSVRIKEQPPKILSFKEKLKTLQPASRVNVLEEKLESKWIIPEELQPRTVEGAKALIKEGKADILSKDWVFGKYDNLITKKMWQRRITNIYGLTKRNDLPKKKRPKSQKLARMIDKLV